MLKITYNVRFYLKPSGLVMVRVRWDRKTQQCNASLGVSADPEKWDSNRQCARKNTTHIINGNCLPARLINASLNEASEYIQDFFREKELEGVMPTADQLKEVLMAKLQRVSAPKESLIKAPSVQDVFLTFLTEASAENSWGPKCHVKYQQMNRLLTEYCPKLKFSMIDKKFLIGWKEWLVKKGYSNHTTVKHFRNLKCFLKWASINAGVDISPTIFAYKPKLPTPLKTVVYLTREEVEQFSKFEFPETKKYLSRARDYFIFMCCTSLRYSDMATLKIASVTEGFIDIYTVKTRDKIRIPLNDQAKEIFAKYSEGNPGELLFSAPSNQKLNDYLKEAAKMAGLDREVVVTSYVGVDCIQHTYKLHEIISCHCGRRTFVCLALALGIPPSVVMSITGHSDYQNMLPYISIGDSTAKQEMKKWNEVVGDEKNEVEVAKNKLSCPEIG